MEGFRTLMIKENIDILISKFDKETETIKEFQERIKQVKLSEKQISLWKRTKSAIEKLNVDIKTFRVGDFESATILKS